MGRWSRAYLRRWVKRVCRNWEPYAPGIEIARGLTLPGGSGAEAVSLAAGAEFPDHRHSYDHTLHVVEGKCLVTFGPGLRFYFLAAGGSMLIPAYVTHWYEALDEPALVVTAGHPAE